MSTSTTILPSTTVDRICASRDAAVARMAVAVRAMASARVEAALAHGLAAEAVGSSERRPTDDRQDGHYRSIFREIDEDAMMRAYTNRIDAATWRNLLDLTGMVHMMDRTAKLEFDSALEGKEVPVASVENVHATFEGLFGDAALIFRRGLARVFSELDRRFKSHDAFKIGARMILSNVFDDTGFFNYNCRRMDAIADVERVFRVLDGRPAGGEGLLEAIRAARAGAWGPRQSEIESEYFTVRVFKNGNAHLWFKRDDLVTKANLELAEYYGAVLPDAVGVDASASLKSKSGVPSKDLAFYATPSKVAREVASRVFGPKGQKLLEPSAGTGSMAIALTEVVAVVDCIEIDPTRAASCRSRLGWKGNVATANFLSVTPTPIYDTVAMNPPFYGTHWMQHVLHAFDFLKPGGSLIAVLPITASISETKKHLEFQSWVERLGGRFNDLPDASFAESGTRVSTCILEVRKPW